MGFWWDQKISFEGFYKMFFASSMHVHKKFSVSLERVELDRDDFSMTRNCTLK